ncbi:MAG TPA: hypothetical protein PLC49_03755, partial [Caldisericia bacterium]|nr:hypothetical protein [Caldisericia bacterium]
AGKKLFSQIICLQNLFCQRQLEVFGAKDDEKQIGPHIALVVGLVLVALAIILTMVAILGRRKKSDVHSS